MIRHFSTTSKYYNKICIRLHSVIYYDDPKGLLKLVLYALGPKGFGPNQS